MKTLNTFIFEKLHLGKTTNVNTSKKDIKDVKIDWHLTYYFNCYNQNEKAKCFAKMKSYYDKGSKPLTLVHTIKNDIKLVNRWFAAILLQWDEAIEVFKEAMIERIQEVSEEQWDAYIYDLFEKGGPNKTSYEHYLELYNIKY